MAEELPSYSEVADQQLDAPQASNPDLYNDVLTVCELVFNQPGDAQAMSAAVHTPDSNVLRLAVPRQGSRARSSGRPPDHASKRSSRTPRGAGVQRLTRTGDLAG